MGSEAMSALKTEGWRVAFLVLAIALGLSLTWTIPSDIGQSPLWQLLYWYAVLLVATSAFSSQGHTFFMGSSSMAIFRRLAARGRGRRPRAPPRRAHRTSSQVLMPSAFITWIFAVDPQLCRARGHCSPLGGFAYAAWYVSFWSAAFVGYMLRTRHGYGSLVVAVDTCYGPVAAFGFGLALLVRLFNEVWSNTTVVASFYGASYSEAWWVAVALSSGVPLSYVLLGGMRSSLLSDVVQAVLAVSFLFVALGVLTSKYNEAGFEGGLFGYVPTGGNVTNSTGHVIDFKEGGWQEGGWTLLTAGLIQGAWSYPFMDPVLTDRTFLSTPRTMLMSFLVGGGVAFTFIVLFGGIGIYGCSIADPPASGNGAPVGVANALGGATEFFITLVMMSSSLSTLDSTFTAAGKAVALEFGGWLRLPGDKRTHRAPLRPSDAEHVTWYHVQLARVGMVTVAVLGTLYLMVGAEPLSATTASGTTVMGLGPPIFLMLVWRYSDNADDAKGWRRSPLAFLLPFVCGAFFGIATNTPFKLKLFPSVGSGKYAGLLGTNIYGQLVCLGACALGLVIDQFVTPNIIPALAGQRVVAQPTVEHPKTGALVPRGGGGTGDVKIEMGATA